MNLKPKNKPGPPLQKTSAVVVSRGAACSHREVDIFVTTDMEICAIELRKDNKLKLSGALNSFALLD